MFENKLTERIAVWLREIGLPVRPAEQGDNWLLPGLTIDRDGIAVDEAEMKYPGDLLHEAGHLAVAEPHRRAVADRDAFTDGAAAILENFQEGRYFGVPLLQWYGMTNATFYPEMIRWVRQSS